MESKSETNLKTKVLNAIRSLLVNCLYYSRWVELLTTTSLIVFEVTDKLIDGATAVEYYKGRLFYNPKESVFVALLVFVILGCFISLGRIYLYFYQLHHSIKVLHPIEGDDFEDRYDKKSLQISALKVVCEAFPQSVIAKFYFVHCAIEKYGWGVGLDASFDFFCGAPFIIFFVSLGWYWLKQTLKRGCSCKIVLRSRMTCMVCAVIITASVGLVFAALSLSDVYKRCS